MTDSYLTQMETHIEKLLAHCESLQAQNTQLTNQLKSTEQTEIDAQHNLNELKTRYADLEQDFNALIAKEHRARISEQQALHEKATLIQLNDQTKKHIEKMISRLKTLEQNA